MTLSQVLKKFQQDPTRMRMGAGKLSKRWNCTKEDIYKARAIMREESPEHYINMPKILIFDIETAPTKTFVWRMWKENISPIQITDQWFMLTWAAKWLYSAETMSDKLTPSEAIAQDDFRLVKNLYDIINEADIIIGHHAEKFDAPKMNTRFLLNGLPPTTPYIIIDTKRIAAKQFGFNHNSLNGLALEFGFKPKLHTDFELWKNCYDGDKAALAYMETYNRYDVELLEDIYLVLRPWIRNHPNIGLYIESDKPVCATCGSTHLHHTNEFYYTQTGKYPVLRCECGALSRGRTTQYPVNKRKQLIKSV